MKILLLVDAAIASFLAWAYGLRPGVLSALTILPAWAWLGLLALPGLPLLRRRHLAHSILFLAAWLTFLGLHVEEIRSVPRGWISPIRKRKPPEALRLVSFNCGGGQPATLPELESLEADIVFLQEPPPRCDVEVFLRKTFGAGGDLIYDLDTAILARGSLTNAKQGAARLFYSHALARLPDGEEIHLISLRLPTGHVRIDLWNPACWSIHRRHRRSQLGIIRQIAAECPEARPLIVAGDFNAPQGDKVFSLLPAALRDAFSISGRGIGNTILNEIPVLRIDQIWISRDFTPLQSFALRSLASDHRLVVSDVGRATARSGPERFP